MSIKVRNLSKNALTGLRSYFMKQYVNCGKRCGHKINWKHKMIFLFVILIWASTFFLFIVYKGDHANERGIFGDMFGAVNALFSGLAFAGLIITLRMQRKELNQTHAEFKFQSRTLKVQRFENTLFFMLSQQQEITNNLHYISKDGADPCEETGRIVFDLFYNTKIMKFKYTNEPEVYGIKGLIAQEGNIQAYLKASDIQFFDHYFRHLYRIFKYINESNLIEDTERYNYAAIVRAQLSEYELLMLFYNALNVEDDGALKFKSLIEKYALFNNIRKDELARIEDVDLYNTTAYNINSNI